jgi:hypothetical protein
MAKFCIVSPPHILVRLQHEGALGIDHLLLAHDVVKHPEDYRHLFGTGPLGHRHIIMDNSAYELKSSVDFQMVKEAVDIARPTCVVLPDIYLDGARTFHGTKDALQQWAEELLPYHVDLMCIPQGVNVANWVDCAENLAQLHGIKWWGVPRNFRELLKSPRKQAVEILHALDPSKKIHLFGFSNDYVDDMVTCQDPRVCSIDSTTPLRAGSLGKEFRLQMSLPKRGNWWEEAEWNDLILPNLDYCRRIFA